MFRIYRAGTTKPQFKITIIRTVKSLEDDDLVHKEGLWSEFINRLLRLKSQPGNLVLIRAGECESNTDKRFTGWIDSDLSPTGVKEAEHAARLLLERGHIIDITYTSMMKRGIRSSYLIQTELDQIFRPMIKSWRLNERMYGALEGLSKPELAALIGEEQVQKWRAGLTDRPPPMSEDHLHWHGNERKYSDLPREWLPRTESLQDVLERVKPLWHSHILPDLKSGRNVMIVAHINSLRGVISIIDSLNTEQTQRVGIPTGIPLVYKFDHEMKPMPQPKAVPPLSGAYLAKMGLLRAALDRQDELARKIEGYREELLELQTSTLLSVDQARGASQATVKTLSKLEEQRKLLSQLILDTGGKLPYSGRDDEGESPDPPLHNRSTQQAYNFLKRKSPQPLSPPLATAEKHDGALSSSSATVKYTHKHAGKHADAPVVDYQTLEKPLLVIIRHGKTEHNKLGLFTGWEDAPLADEGRKEATGAGVLLRKHGIQFDIVYTSWLSRAIETAWRVMEQLEDSLWLPVVKTWRLNERMYGALTGLSKKMIKQRHGQDQFMKWRRGFDEPPPPISSFSHYYPGNDSRYVGYVQDIPISIFETIIRSLAHGRLEISKAFPKSESLKNCMERTVPYYKNVIVPNSLSKGQNVLISSSENAIRGLLMHLCGIPPNEIIKVEIPTGLPLVFDRRVNRIRLLEDPEDTSNPFIKHNFGSSLEFLFKPQFLSSAEFQQIISNPNEPSTAEILRLYDPILRLKD